MIEIIGREAIYFWYYFTVLFEQIFPYWVIGIVIGSVISVFGKKKIFRSAEKWHGKKLGLLGLVPASLLGIISPLCMYGTIPIAASFSEKGMKDYWLAAFMMSSILLNPQLIIYSMVLGTTVVAVQVVSCTLCGITAGLLIYFFYKDKPFFNFSSFSGCENRDTHPNPLMRLLKNIWRNVKATGLYFLLGIILAVVFQMYVPADVFASVFGESNKGFGVLMAATIGVPLYVCGGGTIPLLQSWLMSGMSLGSAAAFMISGPATKITNLGALKIVLGVKHFVFYLVFVMAFALIAGILIDFVV